jgi:hypothetical protein
MSYSSPYAFLDQVNKEDTNLLNYNLFPGKYENCPKNNILKSVNVDNIIKEEPKYFDQSLLNYKNTYPIKKSES